MFVRSRLVALLTVLLITIALSGIAVAQTGGPDPDSPVQERTPTPANDQKEDPFPSGDDEDAEPTEDSDDSAPTAGVEDAASPPSDATPISGDATPAGDATPVASAGDVDLAAMTLDSNSIPEDFVLIAEYYTSPQEIADSRAGQIDDEELFATGIQTFYQSFYINADGNRLRTYVIAFDTAEGATAGFNLFEDEEVLVPNGDLEDRPGPEGVGEAPSEITSGIIEEGDGTQQRTYDISFRIDRFEVGAAMETYDGAEVDEELVDQMAVDLAERVEAVIAGDDVEAVDYNLPAQLITLETDFQLEGYQTVGETFLIDDPDNLPDGFTSGFYRGASFSNNITSLLPFVTVGISSFDSADDVEEALANSDSIIAPYPDLDEIQRLDFDGVDDAFGFTYSSPEGEGVPDSARLFLQVDDHLIVIDVQGVDSAEDAEAMATDIADAELACALDGNCDEPVSLGN
jgi:hypothetical protein